MMLQVLLALLTSAIIPVHMQGMDTENQTDNLDTLCQLLAYDKQIVLETRFYQAIWEGDTPRVDSMIQNNSIDPDKIMRWYSYSVIVKNPTTLEPATPDTILDRFAHRMETSFPKTDKALPHIIAGSGMVPWLPITHAEIVQNPTKYESVLEKKEPYLPLSVAICHNKSDIVKLLVEKYQVDVNACNPNSRLPLYEAVYEYNPLNVDIVTCLIEHGARTLCEEWHGCVYHRNVLQAITDQLPDYYPTASRVGNSQRIALLKQIEPIVRTALAREREAQKKLKEINS